MSLHKEMRLQIFRTWKRLFLCWSN